MQRQRGKHKKQCSLSSQLTVNMCSQEGGQLGFKVLRIWHNSEWPQPGANVFKKKKKKKERKPVLFEKEGNGSGRHSLWGCNGDHLYFPRTDFFSLTALTGDLWHSPAGPCRSHTLTGHYEKALQQGHGLSEATSWPATALQPPGSSCQSGRCCPCWATCRPAAARSCPSGAR